MSTIKLCVMLLITYLVSAPSLGLAEPVSFRKDIVPILMDNCLACHGPKKSEGDYRVDSFERAAKPGESDLAPFTANKIEDSEVYRRCISDDPDERMPLDGEPLKKDQVQLLKQWIEEGSKYDGDDPKADLYAIMLPPAYPAAPAAYPNSMPTSAMVFTPDGSNLIVGGYHELTVWNPQDGSLIRRISDIGQRTFALAISPDGKQLAVGTGAPGRLGEARILSLESGELLQSLGMTFDVVMDVAFSPDGKSLAVAAADNTLRLFEVETGKENLKITSHSDWVTAVSWNKDGKQIVS
ncbi:MAG: hypothetical protein ACI9HK_000263, partial [Pirellulaceae bacterium]